MRMGFTGTRDGMTDQQKDRLAIIVDKIDPDEFHHGDCIGSDAEAHRIVREVHANIWIIGHPPIVETYRAFCDFDQSRKPLDYIKRDHKIVDESELLVATPDGFVEKFRSGTWITIGYARTRIPVFIIQPNGNILIENLFGLNGALR